MTMTKSMSGILACILSVLVMSMPLAAWPQNAELLKKAKGGDAHAQYMLGGRFARGDGVAKDYYVEAAKWHRKAEGRPSRRIWPFLASRETFLLGSQLSFGLDR